VITIKVMTRTGFQMSVAALLGLIVCAALNIWLFRFGALAGIVGLNVSKHLLIAYLCQILGVDRRKQRGATNSNASIASPPPVGRTGPA